MKASIAEIETGLVLVGVGVAAWLAYRAVTGVGRAVANGAVNPANPNNLVNRAVESVGAAVTGDPAWTLGGAIYDFTHPTPTTPAAPAKPTPADVWNFGSTIRGPAAVYNTPGLTGSGQLDPYGSSNVGML